MLTQERLKELLHYDPETGGFKWRATHGAAWVGQPAGMIRQNSYRYIQIDDQEYMAPRLAWLYHYGRWPELQLDHKNRNRDDNRISNLREAGRPFSD